MPFREAKLRIDAEDTGQQAGYTSCSNLLANAFEARQLVVSNP